MRRQAAAEERPPPCDPANDPYCAEPPPADTCNTNDPVLESPAIQNAFALLWQQSNYGPTVPHSQRVEQGGWILYSSETGYVFKPFSSSIVRTPCSIDFPATLVPPRGAVAWVHTHPYRIGEQMTECEQVQLPSGLRVPFTYTGDASFDDDEITREWRSRGYPIEAYIIDADQMTWYTGDDTPGSVIPFPRCGY